MLFKDIKILNVIPNGSIDGKDIINLFEPESNIGKLLCPFTVGVKIDFLKWQFYSTKNLLDFLRLENYKEEWLKKKNHNNALKKEINGLKTRTIPSYWGIIILFLIKKVKSNKKLYNLMLNNELPFNAYKNQVKEVELFSSKFTVKNKLESFHGYCKSIEFVSLLIKSNIINDDEKVKEILNLNFPTMEEDINKLIS